MSKHNLKKIIVFFTALLLFSGAAASNVRAQVIDEPEMRFDHVFDLGVLQLVFERAPDVPQYIQTNQRKLRQTLINLLDNAIKFTHTGGVTLRVSESASQRVGESADRSCADAPTRLLFEVQDTGAGLALTEP
jgi:signal transduction histidine kinase